MSAISLVAAILENEEQERLNGKGSAGNEPMVRGAARVRLSGAVNADGSPSGINGDYARTEELANERSVYVKVGKPSTSMWYYSVAAGHGSHHRQWVVGPSSKVGTEKMWAYSERPSSGHGPESANCPWTVYCYSSQKWVRQTDVVVTDLEERAREIEEAAQRAAAGKDPGAAPSGKNPHLEAAGDAITAARALLIEGDLEGARAARELAAEEFALAGENRRTDLNALDLSIDVAEARARDAETVREAARRDEEARAVTRANMLKRASEEQVAATAAKTAQQEDERQRLAKEEEEARAREQSQNQAAEEQAATAVAKEEERQRLAKEEEEARAREAARKQAEEEQVAAAAAKAAQEEEERQRLANEEEEARAREAARKQAEEEQVAAAAAKAAQEEEERQRLAKEEEARAREAARKQAEEEQVAATAAKAAQQEAERQEAERQRVKEEEEARAREAARKQAEEEQVAAAAAKAAQQEAERQQLAKEEEEARAREAARKQAEEERAAAEAKVAQEEAELQESERQRLAKEEEGARGPKEARSQEEEEQAAAEAKDAQEKAQLQESERQRLAKEEDETAARGPEEARSQEEEEQTAAAAANAAQEAEEVQPADKAEEVQAEAVEHQQPANGEEEAREPEEARSQEEEEQTAAAAANAAQEGDRRQETEQAEAEVFGEHGAPDTSTVVPVVSGEQLVHQAEGEPALLHFDAAPPADQKPPPPDLSAGVAALAQLDAALLNLDIALDEQRVQGGKALADSVENDTVFTALVTVDSAVQEGQNDQLPTVEGVAAAAGPAVQAADDAETKVAYHVDTRVSENQAQIQNDMELAVVKIQSYQRGIRHRTEVQAAKAAGVLPGQLKESSNRGALLSVEDATKVFKEIDVNDNGEISQIELIKAMRSNPLLAQRMGLPTQIRQEDESRRILVFVYAEMDIDNNKGVSLQEFLSYFAGQSAPAQPEPEVTAEDSWDSAMNSEDEWVPQLCSGLASNLLESSVSNLKAEGLVVSVSASEATNSNGSSPLSRPASRPMSARPSRPMSALPSSRPSSRMGKSDLPVSLDGDKMVRQLETAQVLRDAEERPADESIALIPPVRTAAYADESMNVEAIAAQDAESEAAPEEQVSTDNVDAAHDDGNTSPLPHGAKDFNNSGAVPGVEGGDQGEAVETQWRIDSVLQQAEDMQGEAAETPDAPTGEGDAREVQLEVVLQMDVVETADSQGDFSRKLCGELCYAYSVNADESKMVVLALQEGPVVARIAVQAGISAVGDTPLQVAQELIAQLQEEDPALRVGQYGQLISSLRIMSEDEIRIIERRQEEEDKQKQAMPAFVRNPSVSEREELKRMATERFLTLEDGKGIDILDLQNEPDEMSGAEVLDLRSEPSQADEQNLGPLVPDALPASHGASEPWEYREPLELSTEQAVVRLQRCLRGMFDRIFFRKYQKVVETRRREEVQKETRRVNREAQLADARKTEIVVSIPQIDPDGYLSKATVHRIQQRGEPLEKADVARKAKKITTKKFAAIDVATPGSDGVWNIGEVRQIKWKMSGNIHVERVGIYLYLDGEPVHTIVKAVPNVGKYLFTLPEIFEPAEEVYQVLVIAEDPGLPNCHAFSAPFTVAGRKVGQLAKVPPAMPTVTITFPVRSGWSWPTGASYVLAWKSVGVVQNVQIDMLRHGEIVMRIASSLLNCGAFPFAMPPDAPTGEGFQIRVRSVALKKACGISVPFSIIDRQVSQAVPRRAPSEKARKVARIENQNPRLLAPLSPPTALRHTWSAVDAREIDDQLASSDKRAQTVAGREFAQTGGWSPSRPRGQLHVAPDLDTDESQFERTAPLQGGGTGRSIGRGGGSGDVLIPNGNLGTPATAHSSGRSLPNEVGHSAIDIDTQQRPSKFTPDAEEDVIAVETVGEADFETVYNRLRSKYSVKERETGVWLKPEIERYAGKSEEMLQPNAGTQHMMARALAGTPQLSDVNLPGLRQSKSRATTSKKASRRGARSADPSFSGSETASSYQLHKGQQPIKSQFMDSRSDVRADREKIISGAEEFLQMRDEIFAKQLAVLRQENQDRTSTLESQKLGNSTGRYTPVMLPAVDTRDNSLGATTSSASRGGHSTRPHAFGTMSENVRGNDEYRRYDSVRVRQGVANQAIADYYDSVQNKLYGMPPIV